MQARIYLPVFLSICFALAGCTNSGVEKGPRKEITSYSEKLIETSRPPRINIDVDSGNFEVYSWDRKAVKFEVTKKICGETGEAARKDSFKDFCVEIFSREDKLFFKSAYKRRGRDISDAGIELKLFIPKKVAGISCKVGAGEVNFFDDLKADLTAQLGTASAEIRYFEGNITFKADTGSLRIENGKIKRDSSVNINLGNVYIKSQFEESGHYILKTNAGNIAVKLPKDSRIGFESTGTIVANDFASNNYETKVELSSGLGQISIMKY